MADVPLMSNPMTTQGDVITGGASGAAGRLAIGTAGQVLTVNAGATAPEWAAPSGGGGSGQGLVDFGHARRASTSITLNSTTWANVDTGLDLTLDATSGDIIEVGLSALFGAENVVAALDVATIVSAAPVNYVSGGGGVSDTGVSAWYGSGGVAATENLSVGGSVMYTLQAGDISTGTVLLRLRYRTTTAANKTLFATTPLPLQWWAKNLGAAI